MFLLCKLEYAIKLVDDIVIFLLFSSFEKHWWTATRKNQKDEILKVNRLDITAKCKVKNVTIIPLITHTKNYNQLQQLNPNYLLLR